MLFVIFDVEAASFYPWAVQMHALRVFGLLEMIVFIIVLGIGYAYVWKKGGFRVAVEPRATFCSRGSTTWRGGRRVRRYGR